jgi:hypothetical protein
VLFISQAQLLRNIDSVIQVVIALKTHYPKVDISNLIKRKPKLLMLTQQRVDEDAGKVGTAWHSMAWHDTAAPQTVLKLIAVSVAPRLQLDMYKPANSKRTGRLFNPFPLTPSLLSQGISNPSPCPVLVPAGQGSAVKQGPGH